MCINPWQLILVYVLFKNYLSIRNFKNHRNKTAFTNGILSKNRIYRINAGSGMTSKYQWNEDDRNITIKLKIPIDISPERIKAGMYKQKLDFRIDGGDVLISGETIKPFDVDKSFWDLETHDLYRQLTINIKKSTEHLDYWYGVIQGDVILHTDYKSSSPIITDAQKTKRFREPNSLIWESKEYSNYNDLFNFVTKWNEFKTDKTDHVFGLPPCSVDLFFMPEDYGAKILYGGRLLPIDVDEYIDIKIIERDKKYYIAVFRGNETNLINGMYGNDISLLVQNAEARIINKLQLDINKLFDYREEKNVENVRSEFDEYVDQFKKIDLSDKTLVKYFEKELGFEENWTKDQREEHQKSLVQTIGKLADPRFKPGREYETLETLCTGMKESLGLNDDDLRNLFSNAVRRIEDRKAEINCNKSVIPSISDTLDFDFLKPKKETLFDYAIDLNNNSIFSEKYHSMPAKCQEMMRERWEANAKKFDKLVQELFSCDDSLVPTICENYKDLLLSHDLITIMRSKLNVSPPKNEFEKSRYEQLKQFVLSLYKDLEVYMMHNEMQQLEKIDEICEIAKSNIYAVDDYLYDNKQKYDMDFICYLDFAIAKESEQLRNSGVDPDLEPSVWLMILQIIYKGISFLVREDLSEHTEVIAVIIERSMPLLRKTMTKYYLACMAKSDWKGFKHTVNTIANGILKMTREEIKAESPNLQEWIPDAIVQLKNDVEELIPDWVIDGMLSPSDIAYMDICNKAKIPICQIPMLKETPEKPWQNLPVDTRAPSLKPNTNSAS